MPVSRATVVNDIATILMDAHGQPPSVGGLFNAYELAVSYFLLSGFYARGAWDVLVEQPVPNGPAGEKADFLIPLDTGDPLWLELKMWWFCDTPSAAYRTFASYRSAPVADWWRLSTLPGERALLLLRVWDEHPGARERSDRWIAELQKTLPADAHMWPPWTLSAFRYPSSNVQVEGQMHLWSSIPPHPSAATGLHGQFI